VNEELVEAARHAGAQLHARGWKLVTAESCTGGLVAAAITEIASSSAWFERGFITYTNESKQELVDVQTATLARFGAVSEQTVREMALGALTHSGADISIAVSGIAGPSGGTPHKPVGMVCFACAWRTGLNRTGEVQVECRTNHFAGDRAAVRQAAALLALQLISLKANSQVIDITP
jgi:nicotinamide-nucleotide amidase